MRTNSYKRIMLPEYAASQEDAVNRVLQLVEMDEPDPSSLGPHDVIVAVKSASISFVDLLMMSGQYQHMVPLPCTPGMEYAGVVTAVGKEVDAQRLKVGDAVYSDIMLTGPRSKGAYQANGGWASFAIAPDYALQRVPASFSFDQACNFLYGYETAHYALTTRGKIQRGETVLINGASGATGMAGVQVAKILGAQVIATGRSRGKLELVKAFGADHVIDTSDPDNPNAVRRFRDEVKALTGGEGAHMVYDTVGGALSEECMRSLRFAGRHVIVGWAGNTNVAKGRPARLRQRRPAADQHHPDEGSLCDGLADGDPRAARHVHAPGAHEGYQRLGGEGRITHVSHTSPLDNFARRCVPNCKGR
ncbi:MAG: NADPH:quinone oxidoreductase family protein [Xanthobacteraceae bacterium]